MKLKRHNDFKPEVATGSLNDIMFFLLLFFLIVSTFANPNVIKLLLPKAKAGQTTTKIPVTLSITKDKNFFIEKRQIPYESLEAEFKQLKEKNKDITVVLRADASITIQDLVNVLQIGSKLEIKMILATDKKS